jgi:hypothetical protein
VHGGICSATETFCLREANAVVPLVSLLDHNDLDIVEAALGALSTLIMDTVDLEQGSQVCFSCPTNCTEMFLELGSGILKAGLKIDTVSLKPTRVQVS